MENKYLISCSLLYRLSVLILCSCILLSGCSNRTNSLRMDKWEIVYNNKTGGVDIKKENLPVCNNLYTTYMYGNRTVSSMDYTKQKVDIEKTTGAIGKGACLKIVYTHKGLPTMTQYFYIYPGKDYVLTEFSLDSDTDSPISSNYMAPVNIDKMPAILEKGKNNRALFIPFDNDKCIRYKSHPLNFDTLTSYEATAIFNNNDRRALVVGSVEQDNRKTVITIGKGDIYNIGSLACFGGAADEPSHDSKSHGALTGERIKSPTILLGFFDNWCEGLEEYARVSAMIAPPRARDKAVTLGWKNREELEYTTNVLSYGWWRSNSYQHRDTDRIVLREATGNENRTRVTLAIIAGLYIPGNDFLTPPLINSIANGKDFRPVEGNGEDDENRFVRIDKDGTCYCAIFNYTGKEEKVTIVMERLGLNPERKYQVKELWRRIETSAKKQMDVLVPAQDVMLFQII